MHFFDVTSSCNNLNIFYNSDVFSDVLICNIPQIKFDVNGYIFSMATFVKSHRCPILKSDKFIQKTKKTRKYVEHVFRMLQVRFVIIRKPFLA